MTANQLPEVWLRGPVPGISPLLQPVAHALLQAKEELNGLLQEFPHKLLWIKPAGMASVGFHLQHLQGVLDRLLSYARGQSLTEAQLTALRAEGKPPTADTTAQDLVAAFNRQVDTTLTALAEISDAMLLEPRGVGRAQLPSTVLGLLFHAAEHTMRHSGQLLVTVKVLKELPQLLSCN